VVEILEQAHRMCQDAPPYGPVALLACVKREGGEVVDSHWYPPADLFKECQALGEDWEIAECYCCCPWGGRPPVEVEEEAKPIELFVRDDTVDAGYRMPEGRIEWRTERVAFSAGAPAGSATMLGFGGGRGLVCADDQPLLRTDGMLVRAAALRPGDELTARDGTPVRLDSVETMAHATGIHHIGTAAPRDDVDGHLIVLGGVVAGDYYLQARGDAIADDHGAARAVAG
jgi:hypothetical protein